MQTKLPGSVTKKFFIFATKYEWIDEYIISVFESDISSIKPDYILIGTQEVTFEIKETDFLKSEIAGLEKAKIQLFAETSEREKYISRKIQSLLASKTK